MILSFHPCYEADVNRLCAGRDPDKKDLAAIRDARAVILPQGCRKALYDLARQHCAHVFPNYDARFQYPGKTGQARLFQAMEAPHPRTWVFDDIRQFRQRGGTPADCGYPIVFKLDWGGEGETVVRLMDASDLEMAISTAAAFERTGQRGFVLQAHVPHSRTLRVAVIGQRLSAYWRVQDNPLSFGTSLAQGARIDPQADPALRRQALALTDRFCRRAGINLAGFDLIFAAQADTPKASQALFLEINYFFGRSGLGGSDRFYTILQQEIDSWLSSLGLAPQRLETGNPRREQE